MSTNVAADTATRVARLGRTPVVLEPCPSATGLEIRRRTPHRAGPPGSYVVLVGAVVLSLSAQVGPRAERSVIGWLARSVAGRRVPGAVKIVLTRPRPVRLVPAETPDPADQGRPGRPASRPLATRPGTARRPTSPSTANPSPATSSAPSCAPYRRRDRSCTRQVRQDPDSTPRSRRCLRPHQRHHRPRGAAQ